MRSIIVTLTLGLCLISIGCSAVGKMAKDVDMEVKQMQPPPGKGLVYVVRPSVTFGFMRNSISMEVFCDNIHVGTTGGGRYVYCTPDPGPHVFITKAENRSELPIVIEEEQIYYLEQEYRMGLFSTRVELLRLSDSKGRKKLMKCSLSSDLGSSQPGSPPE